MKLILDIEEDYDFSLLGISCHARDYRLSWELNRALKTEFRKEDFVTSVEKNEEVDFPTQRYYDEENHMSYCLISNKFEGKIFIPELKKLDYILKLSGIQHEEVKEKIRPVIQGIDVVIATIPLETEKLKSKPKLVF